MNIMWDDSEITLCGHCIWDNPIDLVEQHS